MENNFKRSSEDRPILKKVVVEERSILLCIRDALQSQIVCFLTLFKRPLNHPLFLNIYVADYIADYSAK